MAGHFTVVVQVKETIDAHAIEDSKGYVLKQGPAGAPVMQERQVIDRLSLVVSEYNEDDAILRAIAALNAARAAG